MKTASLNCPPSVLHDDLFPIAAVRAAFKNLKQIDADAGAADRCHLVIGNGGHDFYAEPACKKMLPAMVE